MQTCFWGHFLNFF